MLTGMEITQSEHVDEILPLAAAAAHAGSSTWSFVTERLDSRITCAVNRASVSQSDCQQLSSALLQWDAQSHFPPWRDIDRGESRSPSPSLTQRHAACQQIGSESDVYTCHFQTLPLVFLHVVREVFFSSSFSPAPPFDRVVQ